jgi:hypothetical protein
MRKHEPVFKRVSSQFIYSFLTIILVISTLSAERVGKILYEGYAEELSDTTIQVPRDIVALSEHIYVSHPDSFLTLVDTPSIFFIIDHSSSMYLYDYDSASSTLYPPADPLGNRFKVTRDLIDTLSNKRRFPGIEVGVAVFGSCLYYDTTDGITVTVSGEPGVGPFDDGGYIPLLKLDQVYNGKTGAEIIKEKLQTRTIQRTIHIDWAGPDTSITYEWVDLTAPSTFFFSPNTDINIGFTAEKKAMRSSTYDLKNHYGLFFSDGEATDGMNADAYIAGTGVPTNFTIFFTETGQAPQSLVDMNTNIQNNGYSTSNPLSTLWPFHNTTYDTLMTFLMKNIISIFEQNISIIPQDIVINGVNDSVIWDGEKFILPGIVPLTGKITDFAFDIDYKFCYDSIGINGDTIPVVIDTSVVTNFSVEVDFNMIDPPDSFEVNYWDRTLNMYYNGNQVIIIDDENMTDLQLQFAFNPGDANYNYTNAIVEIGNSRGTQKDIETLTLFKQGTANLFAVNFRREVNPAGITPGDGILQHYSRDTLTVVFRNKETPLLPLDTLRILIPVKLNDPVYIMSAYYHDNNADGYVDSIFVQATTEIEGGLTNAHVQEMLVNSVTLPAFRNFSILGSGVDAGGFHINVSEDRSHTPVTWVTPADVLVASEYIFPTGGYVEATIAPVYDRVAPLIHWEPRSALLADYQIAGRVDTLGIKFSEPIRNTAATEPFYFLNTISGTNYSVTLRPAGQPRLDSMIFEVVTVNGAMQDGDSLWIHETDRICDTVGNYQNNIQNTKRRLYVDKKYGSVAVECGYYFDNNADGFVDSIYVKAITDIEGGFTAALITEIVNNALTLPAFRNFTVNSSGLTAGGFFITVSEGAANPTTYVTADDKLVTTQFALSNGGTVQAKTVPVYDKVAPLIHWGERKALAIVHQDLTLPDTLFVTFTEPVISVTAPVPFYFHSINNGTPYTANLSVIGQPKPDQMVFHIQRPLNEIDKMRHMDTIWIHEGNLVGDLCKDEAGNTVTNFQNNINNTRRLLYVDRRILPFTFIPVAVSPVSVGNIINEKYKVPSHYIDKLDINELNLTKSGNTYYGMIINLIPDDRENLFDTFEAEGSITILDPLGNTLIENKRMAWDNTKKRIVFAWSVKNRNGRYVGPGMYLCLFDIEETTKGPEHSGFNEKKRVMVGVK